MTNLLFQFVNKKIIESLKAKEQSYGSEKDQPKEKIVKPLKKVVLPEDNDEFKVINF